MSEFNGIITINGVYMAGEESVEVETSIPIRARYMTAEYYLSDSIDGVSDMTIPYEGAFESNNPGMKKVKNFSSGFISKFSNSNNKPETLGPALSDFGFNQNIAIEKQATKMSFKLKNPSSIDYIRNLEIKVMAADTKPDKDGTLQDNTIVLTSTTKPMAHVIKGNIASIEFNPDTGILTVKELRPNEEIEVEFTMEVPEGLNDYYNDLKEMYEDYKELFGDLDVDIAEIHSWIEYKFDTASSALNLGEEFGSQNNVKDSFNGVTNISSQKVTAKPKVYISYQLEPITDYAYADWYILRITATNIGAGPAYGVVVSPPNIPSKSGVVRIMEGWSKKTGIMKGTSLNLGDLQPNETTIGDFTIYAPGISDWTNLPGLALRTQQQDNIIVAPLTLQKYDRKSLYETLDKIDAELDRMEVNIEGAIDKISSDLTSSILSYDDYRVNVIAAEMVTYGLDSLATIINVLEITKAWFGRYETLKKYLEKRNMIAAEKTKLNKEQLQKLANMSDEQFQKIIADGKNIAANLEKSEASVKRNEIAEANYIKARQLATTDVDSTIKEIGKTKEKLIAEGLGKDKVPSIESYESKLKSVIQNNLDADYYSDLAINTADPALKDSHMKKAESYRRQADSDLRMAYGHLNDATMEIKIAMGSGNFDPEKSASIERLKMDIMGSGNKALRDSTNISNAKLNMARENNKMVQDFIAYDKSIEAVNTLSVLKELGIEIKTESVARSLLDYIFGIDTGSLMELYETYQKKGLLSKDTFLAIGNVIDANTLKFASFATSIMNLGEALQVKEVASYAPMWAKDIGNLTRAASNSSIYTSDAEMTNLLSGILRSARENVGGLTKEDFLKKFTEDISKISGKDERISFLIKTATRTLNLKIVDADIYDKTYKELLDAGMDGNEIHEAALKQAIQRKDTELLILDTKAKLEEAKAFIAKYRNAEQPDTAYYPADVILEYLRSLNKQLEYTYANKDIQGNVTPLPDSRVGRYRDIWIYKGVGDSLTPEVLKVGDIYNSIKQLNSVLAEGYQHVANRWNLNIVKTVAVANATVKFALSFGSGGLMANLATGGSLVGLIAGIITGDWQQSLDQADSETGKRAAYAMADQLVNTGLAISKEYQVASSVKSVFEAVDTWRKIDPPISVSVLGIDATDVVVEDGEETATGNAVLTVRNDHTGAISIAPRVCIIDSNGIIYNGISTSGIAQPSESIELTTQFIVPRATLRDPAGFNIFVSFELAEPGTMSIAGLDGPYIKHFFSGSEEQIKAMRKMYDYSQPAGGYLGGEENPSTKTVKVSAATGTGEFRIFLAALEGSALEMEIQDGNGGVAAISLAQEAVMNTIASSEFKSVNNYNDMLIIKNPSGDYTITITAGGDEEHYSLQVAKLPDLGVVPEAAASKTSSTSINTDGTGQEARIEIRVYETGGNVGLDEVEITLSDISDEEGNSVAGGALELVDISGNPIADSSVKAADGRLFIAKVNLPVDLPKGLYKANIKTTVKGDNLNANLDKLIIAAGYSPIGTSAGGDAGEDNLTDIWVDNGDGTASYISTTVIVSDVLPIDPPMDVAYTDLGNGKYEISGKLADIDTMAVLFVDDGASGFMEADETTGLFSGEITFAPREEPYKVYMKAADVFAKYSEAVAEDTILVALAQDTTPPVIEIVFPTDGVTLGGMTQIIFKVTDLLGEVNEGTITATLDDKVVAVRKDGTGRWVHDIAGGLGNGVHTLTITAEDTAGNEAQKTISFTSTGQQEITFTVKSGAAYVSDAKITILQTVNNNEVSIEKNTDSNAQATFSLNSGSYAYIVEKTGYLTAKGTLIVRDVSSAVNIELIEAKKVGFTVTDKESKAIEGSSITVKQGTLTQTITTDTAGKAETYLLEGDYTYTVVKDIYRKVSGSDTVIGNEETDAVTVTMTAKTTGIEVTAPAKKVYYIGDALDLADMLVKKVMADGGKEDLGADDYSVGGFDSSVAVENQIITVSYIDEDGSFTASFAVEVRVDTVDKLVWDTTIPTLIPKIAYKYGEILDIIGAKVKATYESGKTELVNITERMVSGYNATNLGSQTVSINYKGKNVTVDVNVRDYVTGINITTEPVKKLYYIDGTLDLTDMIVESSYASGVKETLTVDDYVVAVSSHFNSD